MAITHEFWTIVQRLNTNTSVKSTAEFLIAINNGNACLISRAAPTQSNQFFYSRVLFAGDYHAGILP